MLMDTWLSVVWIGRPCKQVDGNALGADHENAEAAVSSR
jgi:hypothetical protein